MRTLPAAVATLCLLTGCATSTASGPPGPSASVASSSQAGTPSASVALPEDSPTPGRPDGLPTAGSPSPIASAGSAPRDSLEAAFAQPEAGGIGAFLREHPDYLPGTLKIGDVIVSGSARGPLDLTLKAIPAGTTRMFMTIACVEAKPYRMELARADASVVGASWAESCGYWGGLHGYTTTPFDVANPPTRFSITVPAETRYSYVLYASPGA